jgi:DNA-binding beta-propeller fold protein YncE
VPNDGTAPSIAAEAKATRAVYDLDPFAAITLPPDVRPTADMIATIGKEAVGYLDTSIERAAAGDSAAAQRALDEGFDRLSRIGTAWAIAGAQCGPADPARVQHADLTLPMEMGSDDIAAAFGSLWVTESIADRVVRLDPKTGDVLATIDVGDGPAKMQPADGRLWVRSRERFDAIDPGTNTVTATLAKADVGPATTRNWALDGALWICDGRRLHRYDPTTLLSSATVDVDVECGAVYATPDLVVAWSYNLDEGESGTSAAAFIDPASNTLLATVPLPVDVGWPVVLPESVFFAGNGGSRGVVIDPNTWTVTATPDLGVATGGHSAQPILNGQSIYIPAHDHMNVLVVDSATFTVTDRIEPLGTGAIVIDDGALWVARGQPVNILQRFDLQ